MKNILFIIIGLFLFNISWSQSLCPPNDITTNPDNPINTQNPAMVNSFFDWRDQDFQPYFDPNFLTSFSSTNPYWSDEDYLNYIK